MLRLSIMLALACSAATGIAFAEPPAKPCDLSNPACNPGGAGTVDVPSPLPRGDLRPPGAEPPHGPKKDCAGYAHEAVAAYASMRRFPACLVPDSPRWQGNYKNHYGWCATARPEWLDSENRARDGHLASCGPKR